MERDLASYRFVEQLYEDDHIRILRGSAARGGGSVLLKQLKASTLPLEPRQLEEELSLVQSLAVPGVVHALDVVDLHGEPTLVLDDPGGRSLEEELDAAPISFETKLDLAVRLATIVGGIHHSGVVHRGLSPSIVLWNRVEDRLAVCDFGLATRATRTLSSAVGVKSFVGAPRYVSPEQTGRVGRVVDRRADLYALGGTLYRLFVGRPPFEGNDIAALLHANVARVPERAEGLAADVPPILACILAKLLRKDPDDRYQTANGLAADLRRVAEGERVFELGGDDAPTALRVRETLVGRDSELRQLEALTAELAAGGSAIAYVSGEGGVGKSALLRELARFVFAQCGIYARG